MTSSYEVFANTSRVRVSDGQMMPIMTNCETASYVLIIVLPQLGDFDSLEYAWWLQRDQALLIQNNIALRAVAIGVRGAGQKFCDYTGFNPDHLFIDATASLHQQLALYLGLQVKLPWLSATQQAWFNLLVMCAGIGSPGTLKEVLRGYTGDKNSPALFASDEKINISPFPSFQGNLFDRVAQNCQRPFELATLRLKNMIEVLTNWHIYVDDGRYLTVRGATFLFGQNQNLLYEHRDRGILGFAENMSNPLQFLHNIRENTKI